jgi:hypothetical protein
LSHPDASLFSFRFISPWATTALNSTTNSTTERSLSHASPSESCILGLLYLLTRFSGWGRSRVWMLSLIIPWRSRGKTGALLSELYPWCCWLNRRMTLSRR